MYNLMPIMHTTKLRKVGGSVVIAVPPAILSLLNVGVGATVGMEVVAGQLIVEPRRRPVYALDDLVAQWETPNGRDLQNNAWLDASPVGREIV